ncbi:hypothetical protein MBLNU230_g0853t1 [Neophaeotheca triangularis]
MPHNYGILPEQAQEDALHATRLLMIEERPYRRVKDRLIDASSLLRERPSGLASPPPEDQSGEEATGQDEQKYHNFREDILLDIAAYENSLIRMQLVQNREQRERDHYATEKQKIQDTAKAVKDNTTELKDELVEAQKVMEQKKKYDALAIKILDDKKLPARDDNQEEIRKLQKEIEDLEAEDREFEEMWASRKVAFDRIQAEGQAALNMIKGIKDVMEEDKDETGDDAEVEGEGNDASVTGDRSRMGTPGPEGSTPRPDVGTPLPDAGDDDNDDSSARPSNRFLEVDDATRANSRKQSSAISPVSTIGEQQDTDTEMGNASSTG